MTPSSDSATARTREHFDRVWAAGDAWGLATCPYEQARYDHLLGFLAGRRYPNALELGCGSGEFTRRLTGIADWAVAVDVAAAAVDRAGAAATGPGAVEFRVADIMTFDVAADGPWDLIVLTETVYCLGWLYPLFDVGYLAARLLDATRPGGRLLLSNAYGASEKDWLLRPWLIDTYRDLFRNVGYHVESEDVFRGTKDGTAFRVLTTLFTKPVR